MTKLIGGPADGAEILISGEPTRYLVSEHLWDDHQSTNVVIEHEYKPIDGAWRYAGELDRFTGNEQPAMLIGAVRYAEGSVEQVLFYKQEQKSVSGLAMYWPEVGWQPRGTVIGFNVDVVPAESSVGFRTDQGATDGR